MCGMLTYDFDRSVLNERGLKITYLNDYNLKKTVIINVMFDNVLQWHIFINYEISNLNKEIGIELNIGLQNYIFFLFSLVR